MEVSHVLYSETCSNVPQNWPVSEGVVFLCIYSIKLTICPVVRARIGVHGSSVTGDYTSPMDKSPLRPTDDSLTLETVPVSPGPGNTSSNPDNLVVAPPSNGSRIYETRSTVRQSIMDVTVKEPIQQSTKKPATRSRTSAPSSKRPRRKPLSAYQSTSKQNVR